VFNVRFNFNIENMLNVLHVQCQIYLQCRKHDNMNIGGDITPYSRLVIKPSVNSDTLYLYIYLLLTHLNGRMEPMALLLESLDSLYSLSDHWVIISFVTQIP
jgi:hypothetical protein